MDSGVGLHSTLEAMAIMAAVFVGFSVYLVLAFGLSGLLLLFPSSHRTKKGSEECFYHISYCKL